MPLRSRYIMHAAGYRPARNAVIRFHGSAVPAIGSCMFPRSWHTQCTISRRISSDPYGFLSSNAVTFFSMAGFSGWRSIPRRSRQRFQTCFIMNLLSGPYPGGCGQRRLPWSVSPVKSRFIAGIYPKRCSYDLII